jgi:hypothetical protein
MAKYRYKTKKYHYISEPFGLPYELTEKDKFKVSKNIQNSDEERGEYLRRAKKYKDVV